MNKKLLSVLSTTMIAALLLSACGNDKSANGNEGGEAGGKAKLTMWYWNGAISDSTIEAAKEKFPNIELKAEKLPPGAEFATKLKTTIAGGSDGPDIVAMDSWITEMIPYSDKFVNLNDYGAADLKGDYLDWKWNMASADGGKTQIAMPIDVAPTVLFYREDLYKQAGVPSTPEELHEKVKTWDEFIDVAKQVKDKTKGGTMTINDVFGTVIGAIPEKYFDKDGNFVAEKGQVKQAWDIAVKAYNAGVTFGMSTSAESNAALNNGTIAALIGPTWLKGDIIAAAPDTKGKWRVAYPPGGVGNQGGSFMGALKSSKHPAEAAEVIKFLTNADNLKKGFAEFGNYPSTPSVYGDEDMKQPDEFFGGQEIGVVFGEVAKDVVIAPVDARDADIGNTFLEELALVDTNKKDPEKAWADALAAAKRTLNR